jgi:hypothetical protein
MLKIAITAHQSLFLFVDHYKDQEMIEGVFIEWQKLFLAGLRAFDGHDIFGLYG